MARTTVKPSHDNASGTLDGSTGMPKNVAPTKRPKHGPDVISTPRNPTGGSGYGQNQYGGRSVTDPGELVRSPLAQDMKDTGERGSDAVLDHIVEHGTAKQDDEITGQLRDITGNVPNHPYMTGAKPGGTVPATIGASHAPVIKDPTK